MNEISIKCGIGACLSYNSNSVSKCNKYSDRRMCEKSMTQRKRSAKHRKRYGGGKLW